MNPPKLEYVTKDLFDNRVSDLLDSATIGVGKGLDYIKAGNPADCLRFVRWTLQLLTTAEVILETVVRKGMLP